MKSKLLIVVLTEVFILPLVTEQVVAGANEPVVHGANDWQMFDGARRTQLWIVA